MSQPDDWGVQRDNSGGAVPPTAFAIRADDSFDALLSCHIGSSRPSYAVAGTRWIDNTGTPWILYLYDGSNDIVIGAFNATSGKMQHRWYKGTDITSASTLTIPSDGNYFDVTGTVTVTALSTLQAGTVIKLQFDAALTLTHNGTSLILPGGANITTAAGDEAEFMSLGSGNWKCTNYQVANRIPVVPLVGGNVLTPHENLVVKQVTAATVDIDADAILVKDSNGNGIRLENVDLTADIGSSGADGLDTGSEANSTWYHIWVVYNPATDTTASLLSASATSPVMPSGYTYSGYVGAVYNDGSGDFVDFHQIGNSVGIDEVQVLTSGSAGTDTQIDLSAVVPPSAKEVFGYADNRDTGGNECALAIRPLSGGSNVGRVRFINAGIAARGGPFSVPLLGGQSIYYAVGGADEANIAITGFKY